MICWMFFHRCSYKNSCLSDLTYNSSVSVLIQWSEASKKDALKNFALDFMLLVLKWKVASYVLSNLLLLEILQLLISLTCNEDETHQGLVIASFSMQRLQFF